MHQLLCCDLVQHDETPTLQTCLLSLELQHNIYLLIVFVEQYQSLLTWVIATISHLMPSETAIWSPCVIASYSVALFETGKRSYRIYLSCSPLGAMKRIPTTTPTPTPYTFWDPSKYILLTSIGSRFSRTWFSVHSKMKSTRVCVLIVVWVRTWYNEPQLTCPFGYPPHNFLFV